MALSFIKKYQSSNNGKFPSLNLTHKEVGGSFYTIREIVRDIIQENKVLGPGNPSSKLLNLKYFSEEEEDKGSYLNVHRNISISAEVNGINQVHYELYSSLEEQEVLSVENIAIIKPVTLVLPNTPINENSSTQVLQNELSLQDNISDAIVQHDDLVKTGTNESKVLVTTENEDASGGVYQISSEVQPNFSEDMGIQNAKQSVPSYPTLSGTSFIETELKNEDTYYKIPEGINFLEENTNISETSFTDNLSGTNIFFSDIIDDQKNCLSKHDNGEVFPLIADTFGLDNSSETSASSTSNTSKNFISGHKVLLSSELFEDGDIINSSELETAGLNSTDSIFSISETSNIPNEGVVSFIPFDKEHIISIQTREIASFSEKKVYVEENISVEPGASENDMQLVDKSSSSVNAVEESKNVSSKLLKPTIQEADHATFKAEIQCDTSDTMNGEGFMSSSKEKPTEEPDILETNPLWDAIKSLVSSFIKFWSE